MTYFYLHSKSNNFETKYRKQMNFYFRKGPEKRERRRKGRTERKFLCSYLKKKKKKKGICPCDSVVMNPTSIYENPGSIPGLAHWVEDLALQ